MIARPDSNTPADRVEADIALVTVAYKLRNDFRSELRLAFHSLREVQSLRGQFVILGVTESRLSGLILRALGGRNVLR
jgi:hypothetical protein